MNQKQVKAMSYKVISNVTIQHIHIMYILIQHELFNTIILHQ